MKKIFGTIAVLTALFMFTACGPKNVQEPVVEEEAVEVVEEVSETDSTVAPEVVAEQ